MQWRNPHISIFLLSKNIYFWFKCLHTHSFVFDIRIASLLRRTFKLLMPQLKGKWNLLQIFQLHKCLCHTICWNFNSAKEVILLFCLFHEMQLTLSIFIDFAQDQGLSGSINIHLFFHLIDEERTNQRGKWKLNVQLHNITFSSIHWFNNVSATFSIRRWTHWQTKQLICRTESLADWQTDGINWGKRRFSVIPFHLI